MKFSEKAIGITAGLAITGVIIYYFVKRSKSNALPTGMARFAKCKNGTTVKITNPTPCKDRGGLEKIFVAKVDSSGNPQTLTQANDKLDTFLQSNKTSGALFVNDIK